MTPKEKRIWLAQEATRLSNDQHLKRALDVIERRAIEDALKCNAFQKRKRDEALMKVKVVRALQQELLTTIRNGEESNSSPVV